MASWRVQRQTQVTAHRSGSTGAVTCRVIVGAKLAQHARFASSHDEVMSMEDVVTPWRLQKAATLDEDIVLQYGTDGIGPHVRTLSRSRTLVQQ